MSRLILFLLLAGSQASAQIVNIESQRLQSDTIGWMGSVSGSFSLVSNIQRVTSIDALAHVQYKTQKDLWLFLSSYDYLKGNGQTLGNSMFYHLRYNHKFSNRMRWEAFTQLQKNAFTGISLRLVEGTGPRFRLSKSSRFRLYAATAVLYEYEKETAGLQHRDIRSSSYASFSYLPAAAVELVNTVFYQPLFRKWSDYRVLDELKLDVKTGKHLSLETTFNYLYDAFPAVGAPHLNYGIANGLNYAF